MHSHVYRTKLTAHSQFYGPFPFTLRHLHATSYLFQAACRGSTVLGYLRADVNWSPRMALVPQDLPAAERRDCLEPHAHQQLDVLFSLWCEGNSQPCIMPEIISLHFYGGSDLPLGKYVALARPPVDPTCLPCLVM